MSNLDIEKKLYIHECELKYRIDCEEEQAYIQRLVQNNFKLDADILETDYIPDVKDFKCKENGIILRIRIITGTTNDTLVTLKVNNRSAEIQDNFEIEYFDSAYDKNKFEEINRVLLKYVGAKIPDDISKERNMKSIIKRMSQNGFSKNRMLSQKRRRNYTRGNIKVSFDTFPRQIGKYMEVEATSPEDLGDFVKRMKFNVEKIEKLNYGKLIQEKQKELPEHERRVCVFESIMQ